MRIRLASLVVRRCSLGKSRVICYYSVSRSHHYFQICAYHASHHHKKCSHVKAMFRVSTNGRFSVLFSPWRKRQVRWRRLSRCGMLTRLTAGWNLKYYLIEVDTVKLYGAILVQTFKRAKLTVRSRRPIYGDVSIIYCLRHVVARAGQSAQRSFRNSFAT
jgi:hypothetical protein